MKVTLEIGNPVESPMLHSTYEVVTEYMHGDADGNTTKTNIFHVEEEDTLKLMLIALDRVGSQYNEEDVAEIFEELGLSEDEAADTASDFCEMFKEYDMTYEGNTASHTGTQVFFWTADGNKHDVSWTITE